MSVEKYFLLESYVKEKSYFFLFDGETDKNVIKFKLQKKKIRRLFACLIIRSNKTRRLFIFRYLIIAMNLKFHLFSTSIYFHSTIFPLVIYHVSLLHLYSDHIFNKSISLLFISLCWLLYTSIS
jgi:hypothetical protein